MRQMNPLALFQACCLKTWCLLITESVYLQFHFLQAVLVACIIAIDVTMATTLVTNPFTLCLVTKVVSNSYQLCTYLSD